MCGARRWISAVTGGQSPAGDVEGGGCSEPKGVDQVESPGQAAVSPAVMESPASWWSTTWRIGGRIGADVAIHERQGRSGPGDEHVVGALPVEVLNMASSHPCPPSIPSCAHPP